MDDRFQHLLAINRAIAESLDHGELLELVVEKSAQLLAADECALLLRAEDGLARVAASRGLSPERVAAFAAPLDERIHVSLRQLFSYSDDNAFLGVPVVHSREVTGILVVHRSDLRREDPDDELLLAALADQTAIALDRTSRYRDLWLASQQAQQELETAARRKDEFLAMLSHELRNPLAAIANALSVLELATPKDSRLARIHEAAARQARHMKRLLDDLLDVSRVTRDHIELERKPVKLQDIVYQALQGTAQLVGQRQHRLSVTVPDEPVLVDGDADRLVQVISNLVTNAAKYTEAGGNLDIDLTADSGEAVVRVRDDGIGIPADLLPAVFDLFVQARRDAGRSEGGLGIGLSLVKRLVEMHGGTVTASSGGPGQGSEFVVRLPRLADGTVPRAAATTAEPSASRRVLLVEDNDDVGNLLAEALRGIGHEVALARDGEAALAEVDRQPPEAILVDIGLPGIDGYELARRLRARLLPPAERPLLVAVTGYGSERDRARALEAGFDYHLIKPVRLEQLTRLLATGAR